MRAATVVGLIGSALTPMSCAQQEPVRLAPGGVKAAVTARVALGELPVKGRAPKAGYAPALFPHWVTVIPTKCDRRQWVLRRDLTGERLAGCRVLSGTLHSKYTGATIRFDSERPSAVQIDHVVALSNAWQTGAQSLSLAKRREFANDPLNLIAVEGTVNRAKSDGDAATWLPSKNRCAYVARQIAVKSKYGLWVTAAESDSMRRVLVDCPRQGVPHA